MKRNRRRPGMTGSWKAQWKTVQPVESPKAAWGAALALFALIVAGVVILWNSPGETVAVEAAPIAEPAPEEDVSYVDDVTYVED